MNKESQRIYDSHSIEIIARAAADFALSRDSFERLRAFESVVFNATDGEIERIIKITHSIHRHPDEITSEFHWLEYLAENGVALARPVLSVNNRFIELFSASDGSLFMICCFEKIDGVVLSNKFWSPVHFRAWGEMVGRLHRVSASYEPVNGIRRRHDWRGALLTREGYEFTADQRLVHERYLALVEQIEGLPETETTYGLIHGDLHQGNFLVTDHTSDTNFSLVAFDFDDAHYGGFAHDIAMPLVYILHASGVPEDMSPQREFARSFMTEFLRGYSTENLVTRELLAQIPLFITLREIDLYCLITYYEFSSDPWENRFLVGRKERIENQTPYIDIDFSQLI